MENVMCVLMTCDCNCHYGHKEKECKNCNCVRNYSVIKFTNGEELRFVKFDNGVGVGKDKNPPTMNKSETLKLIKSLLDMIT